MSALLDYLNIADKKSYQKWALDNHPDKRPLDPDAARKFQEVSAEWQKQQVRLKRKSETPYHPSSPRPAKEPSFNEFMARMHSSLNKHCKQPVAGVAGGMCLRERNNGDYCFWHQPGTDHLKFVDEPDTDFFGKLFDIQGDRTAETCEERCANGKFCHGKKARGETSCGIHIRARKRREVLEKVYQGQ